MGLDRWGLDYVAGRATRTPLGRTATIGRQWIHADRGEVTGIVGRHLPELSGRPFAGFCDDLLRAMGASDVVSFDASDYEGATVVHDLNTPLPPRYETAYDTVVESGSLEHVFDVRTALANVMSMPVQGGQVLLMAPANNQMGHGFYQLSPELFFRAFSPENGYELTELFVVTQGLIPRTYRVTDPARLGDRAEMLTSVPTYLFLHARRTAVVTPLSTPLQQSDYSAAWDGIKPASSQSTVVPERRWVKRIPLQIRYVVRFARLVWRLRFRPPGMIRVPGFAAPAPRS